MNYSASYPFGLRSCRDHYHVTYNGEDYATQPNELTQEEASEFMRRENFRINAWQTVDAFTALVSFLVGSRPSPDMPNESSICAEDSTPLAHSIVPSHGDEAKR